MNNVSFIKRVFAQIINYIIYFLLGYGSVVALLILKIVNPLTYAFIGYGASFLFRILFALLITATSKYLSIGGVFFKIRIVAQEEKDPKFNQIIIRILFESLIFFLTLDFVYLLLKRTARSVIDRASGTFLIDMNSNY